MLWRCVTCARDIEQRLATELELRGDLHTALQTMRDARPETYTRAKTTASWQHADAPLPFYVMDFQQWPDDEKLAWLRQELGDDADLPNFAASFLTHFSSTVHRDGHQKSKVLELFAQYDPDAKTDCPSTTPTTLTPTPTKTLTTTRGSRTPTDLC